MSHSNITSNATRYVNMHMSSQKQIYIFRSGVQIICNLRDGMLVPFWCVVVKEPTKVPRVEVGAGVHRQLWHRRCCAFVVTVRMPFAVKIVSVVQARATAVHECICELECVCVCCACVCVCVCVCSVCGQCCERSRFLRIMNRLCNCERDHHHIKVYHELAQMCPVSGTLISSSALSVAHNCMRLTFRSFQPPHCCVSPRWCHPLSSVALHWRR